MYFTIFYCWKNDGVREDDGDDDDEVESVRDADCDDEEEDGVDERLSRRVPVPV